MRHDLVRQFDREQTPQAAVRLWGGDPATLAHAGDSRNFVYRFRHPGGQNCFLRLAHDSDRKRGHIEAELEFVLHLDRSGCQIATPVASTGGHWVQTMSTPQGPYHAVAFWEIHGIPVKWGDDAENRQVLFERGIALSRIHDASAKFNPAGTPRFRWNDDLLMSDPQNGYPQLWEDAEVRREFEAVREWTAAQDIGRDAFGLVHGDPLSSNFLRSGGRALAFDFDDCCYHWFLFDLAVAISAGRSLPDKYRLPYLKCLLDGYAQSREVKADTSHKIEWFARLAALNRYATWLQEMAGRHGDPAARNELDRRRRDVVTPARWAM